MWLRVWGGGYVHALEVVKGLVRVAGNFEVTLFPSTDTLLLVRSNEDKELLLRKLDELSKLGIKIADGFAEFLDRYKPMSLGGWWEYQVLRFTLARE
jgi:hypothetical protein